MPADRRCCDFGWQKHHQILVCIFSQFHWRTPRNSSLFPIRVLLLPLWKYLAMYRHLLPLPLHFCSQNAAAKPRAPDSAALLQEITAANSDDYVCGECVELCTISDPLLLTSFPVRFLLFLSVQPLSQPLPMTTLSSSSASHHAFL